jgi:hypothetical protein
MFKATLGGWRKYSVFLPLRIDTKTAPLMGAVFLSVHQCVLVHVQRRTHDDAAILGGKEVDVGARCFWKAQTSGREVTTTIGMCFSNADAAQGHVDIFFVAEVMATKVN